MYLWIETILNGVCKATTEITSSLSVGAEGLFTFLTRIAHGL
jgi:hypothetical protein